MVITLQVSVGRLLFPLGENRAYARKLGHPKQLMVDSIPKDTESGAQKSLPPKKVVNHKVTSHIKDNRR